MKTSRTRPTSKTTRSQSNPSSEEAAVLAILLPLLGQGQDRLTVWSRCEVGEVTEDIPFPWSFSAHLLPDGTWRFEVDTIDGTIRSARITWWDVLRHSGSTPREVCLDAITRWESRSDDLDRDSPFVIEAVAAVDRTFPDDEE
jgi:hypothetical protein